MKRLKAALIARIPEAIICLALAVCIITFLSTLDQVAAGPAAHLVEYSEAPCSYTIQNCPILIPSPARRQTGWLGNFLRGR